MADYSKEDLLQLVKRIADYLTIKLSSLFSLSPDSLVRSSLSLSSILRTHFVSI